MTALEELLAAVDAVLAADDEGADAAEAGIHSARPWKDRTPREWQSDKQVHEAMHRLYAARTAVLTERAEQVRAGRVGPATLDAVQARVGQWWERERPAVSLEDLATGLCAEADNVARAVGQGPAQMREAVAACQLVLVQLAYQAGFSLHDATIIAHRHHENGWWGRPE